MWESDCLTRDIIIDANHRRDVEIMAIRGFTGLGLEYISSRHFLSWHLAVFVLAVLPLSCALSCALPENRRLTPIMSCTPLPTKTLPPTFLAKKQRILNALATPSSSYTDRSPKGSVDDGIKDLIDRINRLEGIVTTSSCAGRISVFLQGRNNSSQGSEEDDEGEEIQDGADKEGGNNDVADSGGGLREHITTLVPGGKGRGGRWLFVSHEPVKVLSKQGLGETPLFTLFGLSHVPLSSRELNTSQVRYVRFQFEPMVSRIYREPVITQLSN